MNGRKAGQGLRPWFFEDANHFAFCMAKHNPCKIAIFPTACIALSRRLIARPHQLGELGKLGRVDV